MLLIFKCFYSNGQSLVTVDSFEKPLKVPHEHSGDPNEVQHTILLPIFSHKLPNCSASPAQLHPDNSPISPLNWAPIYIRE